MGKETLDAINREVASPIYRGETAVAEKEYLTDAFGREAVAFIEKHKSEPWFVYLPFNAVHAPPQATDKYLSRFARIQDEKRRTFAAMLSAADDAVGAVLAEVRNQQLEENTLIFFISDNGGPTRPTRRCSGGSASKSPSAREIGSWSRHPAPGRRSTKRPTEPPRMTRSSSIWPVTLANRQTSPRRNRTRSRSWPLSGRNGRNEGGVMETLVETGLCGVLGRTFRIGKNGCLGGKFTENGGWFLQLKHEF